MFYRQIRLTTDIPVFRSRMEHKIASELFNFQLLSFRFDSNVIRNIAPQTIKHFMSSLIIHLIRQIYRNLFRISPIFRNIMSYWTVFICWFCTFHNILSGHFTRVSREQSENFNLFCSHSIAVLFIYLFFFGHTYNVGICCDALWCCWYSFLSTRCRTMTSWYMFGFMLKFYVSFMLFCILFLPLQPFPLFEK